MTDNCSPKEIEVYHGVIKLIEQGTDLHNVKVSDIASAAGIGKGTLYNYFQSKEEIIAKTVLYCITTQIELAIERLEKVDGFKAKCNEGFDILEESTHLNNGALRSIILSFDADEVKSLVQRAESTLIQKVRQMKKLSFDLALLGSREGLFPPPEDRDYVFQTFLSALGGFFQTSCNPKQSNSEKSRENAYKLIIKALG